MHIPVKLQGGVTIRSARSLHVLTVAADWSYILAFLRCGAICNSKQL